MTPSRRRLAIICGAGLVAVILVGSILVAVMDPDGEGQSGNGFTLEDRFYLLSDAEVRGDRLGELLEAAVAYQDTTAEVRSILGVAPDTAVAARIAIPGEQSGETTQRWMLLSPDPARAADPWSDPLLAPTLAPSETRD